jgi:hypothetical protein
MQKAWGFSHPSPFGRRAGDEGFAPMPGSGSRPEYGDLIAQHFFSKVVGHSVVCEDTNDGINPKIEIISKSN